MQANFDGTEFDNLYITKPIVDQVDNLKQKAIVKQKEFENLELEIETFTDENIQLTIDSMKYQYLYDNVLRDLDKFMVLFRDGSLNILSENITREYTQDTGLSLVSNIYKGDNIIDESSLYDVSKNGLVNTLVYSHKKETFLKYRDNVHRILDGLSNAIVLYKNCMKIEEENANLKDRVEEFKDILDNRELLEEYYQKRSSSVGGLTVGVDLSKLSYTLLPQIEVYLQRHGAPPNGIFSSELMAPIVQDLIDANVLEAI